MRKSAPSDEGCCRHKSFIRRYNARHGGQLKNKPRIPILWSRQTLHLDGSGFLYTPRRTCQEHGSCCPCERSVSPYPSAQPTTRWTLAVALNLKEAVSVITGQRYIPFLTPISFFCVLMLVRGFMLYVCQNMELNDKSS